MRRGKFAMRRRKGIKMDDITFEKKQARGVKKEVKEWLRLWCDDTTNDDLPRVLLIGDSINEGYQGHVRNMLAGIAYVDYVSTSYSLDNPIYEKMIVELAKNSHYDLITYNFGLHGAHLSARSYRARYEKVLLKLLKCAPVIPVSTTMVYKPESNRPNAYWKKRVLARNAALYELAEKHNLPVCDLYKVCLTIPVSMRTSDGVHFAQEGYNILATAMTAVLREHLGK